MKLKFTLLGSSTAARHFPAPPPLDLEPVVAYTKYHSQLLFTRRVENLLPNINYRVKMVVSWVDKNNRQLKAVTMKSPPCKQPDSRPDVAIHSLSVEPTESPLLATYRVALTTDFNALFAEDATVTLKTLSGSLPITPSSANNEIITEKNRVLPAGQILTLAAKQSRCQAGENIAAELNISSWLDRDAQNNRITQACPLP